MMESIIIKFSDGRSPESCDSIVEAEERVQQIYPNCEIGDWERDDPFAPRFRALVWVSEEDAEDDDGSNAVAEIIRIERE